MVLDQGKQHITLMVQVNLSFRQCLFYKRLSEIYGKIIPTVGYFTLSMIGWSQEVGK